MCSFYHMFIAFSISIFKIAQIKLSLSPKRKKCLILLFPYVKMVLKISREGAAMNENLQKLRNLVFATDNTHCFIERETILARIADHIRPLGEPDKQIKALCCLLDEISTPIDEADYFAGRMLEAPLPEDQDGPNMLLFSLGHMSPDYKRVLSIGLSGILDEAKKTAQEKDTDMAREFASNAEVVVYAIKSFCERYAEEAEMHGKYEMARALRTVPFAPAYDYYSALQAVWMIHFIASCVIGARDYAFGHLDAIILPYYNQALAEGRTREELTELLAGFFMKTNEICGRATHNYKLKPTLSQSSKQYVNIGGENTNEFSCIVLDAAMMNNMAHPTITVLLDPEDDKDFTKHVFSALAVLNDKMNIYNYKLVTKSLIDRGVPETVARQHTYSACSTLDFDYHNFRQECFIPTPQLFLETLYEKERSSITEILDVFREKVTASAQKHADSKQHMPKKLRGEFILDSLLLTDASLECSDPADGDMPYNLLNIYCPAVATLGDSLMVLDKLVFTEGRYSFAEFVNIIKNNYNGYEELRHEILSLTRFGNNTSADDYTVALGNTFIEAIADVKTRENFFAIPSFYSLERDRFWYKQIGATPDGRLAEEFFSDNQSPSYGADKEGVTAMLQSVAKLPFNKTGGGALNVGFSKKQSPEILEALVRSYFELGGIHVGISILDKETLRDAMAHPEKYPALTVRLYGFSEYFISLPEWRQRSVLDRTAY